jgi:hypothetical protein
MNDRSAGGGGGTREIVVEAGSASSWIDATIERPEQQQVAGLFTKRR